MHRKHTKLDSNVMSKANHDADRRCKEVLELAFVIIDDIDSTNRLKAQYCQACFYLKQSNLGVADATVTEVECGLCDTIETYEDTNTDVICMECASDHSLCKKCGGDINMDRLRESWPAATKIEDRSNV